MVAGAHQAVEPLIAAIGHPVAEVRAAAIECINDDRALEPIIAALRDPVDEVRAGRLEAGENIP